MSNLKQEADMFQYPGVLDYIILPDKCRKRARRSIRVLEFLWLYGPLTFTDIRQLLKNYGEEISDKVLNEILISLRSARLISEVVAEVGGSKKKLYVITGRGSRGIMVLRLADYIDKKYLRHILGNENEYYNYVKALVYTYYASSKRLHSIGEATSIIIDNIEEFRKVAEITTSCLNKEEFYEKRMCIKDNFFTDSNAREINEEEKKRHKEILGEFVKLLRKFYPKCSDQIDSIIIHVTQSRGKVEIYGGYYHRFNPVYAVASLLTTRRLDYTRCNSLLYIKGDFYHTMLALELLIRLQMNRNMYKVLMEEVLGEYYADYGDSADAINPASEYNVGYDITPRDTIILIEGEHIEDKRLLLDVSRLRNIAGKNVLIVARELRKLNAKIPLENITIIHEVSGNNSSPGNSTPENDADNTLLEIQIDDSSRIDIYLVYKKEAEARKATPRLLLKNMMYCKVDKPTLVIWRGKRLYDHYTVPEPPGCGEKTFLIDEMISVAKEAPDNAFNKIMGLIEEYIRAPPHTSERYISRKEEKLIELLPLCAVKEYSAEKYVSEKNGKNLIAEGPLIRIAGGMHTFKEKYSKITVHVLLPAATDQEKEPWI